jgi:hypothetical protein
VPEIHEVFIYLRRAARLPEDLVRRESIPHSFIDAFLEHKGVHKEIPSPAAKCFQSGLRYKDLPVVAKETALCRIGSL